MRWHVEKLPLESLQVFPTPPSTSTHVALPRDFGKGRMDWLKDTFKSYVKMEGTKDRTHPFPQLTHYVIIRIHPSSPP